MTAESFDWVATRFECSLAKTFTTLRLGVQSTEGELPSAFAIQISKLSVRPELQMICFPSGEKAGSQSSAGSSVIWRIAPLAIERTQRSRLPLRFEEKITWLPSGE